MACRPMPPSEPVARLHLLRPQRRSRARPAPAKRPERTRLRRLARHSTHRWSVEYGAAEIEREIDARHVTVAVLTDGSYKSSMCRGEQILAIRKGKRLIPVLGTKGVDIPVYIEALHHLDFTDDVNYAVRLAELLADIRSDATATLPDKFRETSYVTVPPLPVNFVERPEAPAALRDALITDDAGRHIALTALQGMRASARRCWPNSPWRKWRIFCKADDVAEYVIPRSIWQRTRRSGFCKADSGLSDPGRVN